jgi:hypothetical protein
MLKLGSLAEKIGQLLTALNHDCRLSAHDRKLFPARAVLDDENIEEVLGARQRPTHSPSISEPDRSAKTPAASASTTSEGKVGCEGAMVTDPMHASTGRGVCP